MVISYAAASQHGKRNSLYNLVFTYLLSHLLILLISKVKTVVQYEIIVSIVSHYN